MVALRTGGTSVSSVFSTLIYQSMHDEYIIRKVESKTDIGDIQITLIIL